MEVFDAIVIGSGAAGLMFANELAKTWDVLILTKEKLEESNTKYAQGGIAAALSIDDDYQKHINDTLRVGAGLCNIEAVKILVYEAPARIRDLMIFGVEFDKREDNTLLFTREGGHSCWRVLHVGDMTGLAIEEKLIQTVRKNKRIKIVEHIFVKDLIVHNGICYGVIVLNEKTGEIKPLFAKTVFLATGGCGQIFLRTSNPSLATGDGIAMVARVGGRLENMEFVQFHPTVFYKPPSPMFLISEAVRGEGGILIDDDGNRIMETHKDKDLAPRDIVSRTIYMIMQKKNLECVYLDTKNIDEEYFKTRFPFIYQKCLENGVDPTKEPIPVVPAAHYLCGGVKTDIDGKTDIISLYAGGEVACTGVHGANRLASNSLLESVVFAYRAAVNADRYLRYLPQIWFNKLNEIPIDKFLPKGNKEPDLNLINELKLKLKNIMWKYCGIVRSNQGLKKGLQLINSLFEEYNKNFSDSKPSRPVTELENMLIVAKNVIQAAIKRKQNVGTHFNIDLDK